METPKNAPRPGVETLRPQISALMKARRFGEALALCEAAQRAHQADIWLANVRAYLLLNLGRHELAAAAAREAMVLGAGDATAPFVLGESNRHLGRHAEAAEAYLVALRKAPDRADIACLALEARSLADGLDAAGRLFQQLSAQISDPRLAACWAKLLFRAGADQGLPAGFRAAPLMSVPEWAGRHGVQMDWEGEPEEIPWLDPTIASEPGPAPTRRSYLGYKPYVCTIRDAQIFSKSSMVLTPDGAVLHDSTADRDYGRFLTNFMSELVVSDRLGDRLLLDVGRYQPPQEIEAAFFLSGSVSEHFGHWLSEYLPRLNLFRHHPRFETLPIIVDSVMPPQHFDYLRLVVSNPVVTLPPGGSLLCRQLVVAAPVAFYPVHLGPDHGVPPERQGPISVQGLRFIREQVLARIPPPRRTDRKIYISRSKRGGRRPRNENEISAHLAAHGFETVYPEEMTFAEQVRLFQESQVVVLSTGSAVVNCIFSAPGTKFFVLSQRGLFNWGLGCGWMDAMGYPVTFICDREETPRKHDDYTIALSDLDTVLDLDPAARA